MWLQPVSQAQGKPFSSGLGVKPLLWQVPPSGTFPSMLELRHGHQRLLEEGTGQRGGRGSGQEDAGPRGEEEGVRVPAAESPSPGPLNFPAEHGRSVE